MLFTLRKWAARVGYDGNTFMLARSSLHLSSQGELVDTIKPGRYRHFKGNEYEVIGVARDSESMQPMVVYRALYGERGLWVRSAEMFSEVIEREGMRVQRFQYVEDAADAGMSRT